MKYRFVYENTSGQYEKPCWVSGRLLKDNEPEQFITGAFGDSFEEAEAALRIRLKKWESEHNLIEVPNAKEIIL